MQTRVDDLHPRVAQRACDDLRPPVVSVETGFCDHDTDLARPRAGQVYEREIDGRGLLPGLAEPWRRAVGLPARGRPGGCSSTAGPGVLAPAARARDAGPTSTRSRSPTGTSTTGATSSRGSGAGCSAPGDRRAEARALGAARGLGDAGGDRRPAGQQQMFEERFRPPRVRRRRALRGGRLRGHARCACSTTSCSRSASAPRRTGRCSPTRATRARATASPELARGRRPVRLRGDAARAEPDGRHARPPRRRRRRSRRSRRRAPSGSCSPTGRTSGRSTTPARARSRRARDRNRLSVTRRGRKRGRSGAACQRRTPSTRRTPGSSAKIESGANSHIFPTLVAGGVFSPKRLARWDFPPTPPPSAGVGRKESTSHSVCLPCRKG